jgi:hypothetical protein
MTNACYRIRHDVDLDRNPLAAALPFQIDARRCTTEPSLNGLPIARRAQPARPEESSEAPLQQTELVTQGVLALVDAVQTSVLESYRPRNPFGDVTAGRDEHACSAAPITLLTWEMGGDRQAAALIDHALKPLPRVIDHHEFKGRRFRSRQLVSATVEIQSVELVRSLCVQVLKATDDALGTTLASRISRHTSHMATAIAAVQACRATHLGVLCVHATLPLSSRDAASAWELFSFLQTRCGMALVLCCSEESARRLAAGGRSCQRLRAAKLFGLSRVVATQPHR